MAIVLTIGILISMIGLITVDKQYPPLLLGTSDFLGLNSPWLYLGEFFQLFQIQIFYLWVLQSKTEASKVREGNSLYVLPTVLVFVFTILFSLLGYLCLTENSAHQTPVPPDFTKLLVFLQQSTWGKTWYWLQIIQFILVFPYQFYIGKEFFFVLYDEATNASLSKKIEELKCLPGRKNRVTQGMVLKIQDDLW